MTVTHIDIPIEDDEQGQIAEILMMYADIKGIDAMLDFIANIHHAFAPYANDKTIREANEIARANRLNCAGRA